MENINLELSKLADKILEEAGFTIWGMPKDSVDPNQTWMEYRMQTGAYRNNGDKRRN